MLKITDNPLLSNNNHQIYENSSHRRTLLGRTFSKIEAGSLRASIFAMSSLALGTACLTLPQKFQQMSL